MIVPLLVLWLGYGPREATGTSLAAIVFIAAFAAATQGAYGNVHVLDAVLDGRAGGRRRVDRDVAATAPADTLDLSVVRGGAGGERGGAVVAVIAETAPIPTVVADALRPRVRESGLRG